MIRGTLKGPLTDAELQEQWRRMNAEAIRQSKIGQFWRDPMNWLVGAILLMTALAMKLAWFS